MLRTIDIRVVEAGVAHELGQEASIGSHSRDADAHVCIDLEDLLLVHRKIMRALFQSDKDL